MVWWFLLKHKVVVDWSINEIKENPAPPFLSSHWDGVIGFHLIIFIHSTHHLQTFLVLPCSLSTILNLSAHLCSTPLLSPMFIYIWLMNYSFLSIFSCFQGNFQFIMLTWSKKSFGNFKFKPIKHYSSDKRKLGWKNTILTWQRAIFIPQKGTRVNTRTLEPSNELITLDPVKRKKTLCGQNLEECSLWSGISIFTDW